MGIVGSAVQGFKALPKLGKFLVGSGAAVAGYQVLKSVVGGVNQQLNNRLPIGNKDPNVGGILNGPLTALRDVSGNVNLAVSNPLGTAMGLRSINGTVVNAADQDLKYKTMLRQSELIKANIYGGTVNQGEFDPNLLNLKAHFTKAQQGFIDAEKDPEKRNLLIAQITMQNEAELSKMISNLLQMMHEAAMGIIQNIRA